jgi:hypothetical protein
MSSIMLKSYVEQLRIFQGRRVAAKQTKSFDFIECLYHKSIDFIPIIDFY